MAVSPAVAADGASAMACFHPADFCDPQTAASMSKRLGLRVFQCMVSAAILDMRSRRSSVFRARQRIRLARRRFVVMGLIGLVVLGMLAHASAPSLNHRQARARRAYAYRSAAACRSSSQPGILLCFFYFIFSGPNLRPVGLQTFLAPPVLKRRIVRFRSCSQTSAVTAYFAGRHRGHRRRPCFLAVRTARHDRVAGTGLLAGRRRSLRFVAHRASCRGTR